MRRRLRAALGKIGLDLRSPPQRSRGTARDPATPIVSIILPTRDRAHVVCDAIASVRAQSFPDWELIVVDDGSSDDTADRIAPELADARIRYVGRRAGGVGVARNHGLGLARGRYVAYIDSDNLWYPDFLGAAVPVLEADPACDLIYGVLETDAHELEGTCLLWQPFDRDRLLAKNFIDLNVIMHRKSLVDRFGGFDETLDRFGDWDLVLRYTEHAPARAIRVLAARYRVCDDRRITDTIPYGSYQVAIQAKWYPPARLKPGPRVLYVTGAGVCPGDAQIESEIRCMSRWGAQVETCQAHDGTLADMAARMRPDVIHVHVTDVPAAGAELSALGLPVTVRLHESAPQAAVHPWLDRPMVRAVYVPDFQGRGLDAADPRIRTMLAAFDSVRFRPCAAKDRRLVVAVASRAGDAAAFPDLAARLPDHRCVLADRAQFVALMAEAGTYICLDGMGDAEPGAPIARPSRILEAMATGAQVLVPAASDWRHYAASTATPYRDIAQAAGIIAASTRWPPQVWRKSWIGAINHAFLTYADELALRPMFEEWCAIGHAAQNATHATAPAGATRQADDREVAR